MKEILLEEPTLSLNKEITSKVKKIDTEIKELEALTFKELIERTSLSIPLITDYDLQEFKKLDIIKDLDTNEQDVQKYLKLKKEYPNLQNTFFDIESYYIKKNYLDKFKLLIEFIEEYKTKFETLIKT